MDIYLQYWEAIVDNIQDPDAKKKMIAEIKAREEGLLKGCKCRLIGARCNWPYCIDDMMYKTGYCSP